MTFSIGLYTAVVCGTSNVEFDGFLGFSTYDIRSVTIVVLFTRYLNFTNSQGFSEIFQQNNNNNNNNNTSLRGQCFGFLLILSLLRDATQSSVLPWEVVCPCVRNVEVLLCRLEVWNTLKIISRLLSAVFTVLALCRHQQHG